MRAAPRFLRTMPSPAMRDITAFILAGGLGTRLAGVLSPGAQKVIAPVGGRPFLTYLLDWLSEFGVEHAVLCVGFGKTSVAAALGSSYNSIRLDYSEERTPLGTGGALHQALSFAQSEIILALNGDSICPVDLADCLELHRRASAQATLVVCHQPDASRFGRVIFGEDRRVVGFGEKSEQGAGWINAGVYFFQRGLFADLPNQRPLSLEYDLMPRWILGNVFAYSARVPFVDIGTPESYTQARELMAEWRVNGMGRYDSAKNS